MEEALLDFGMATGIHDFMTSAWGWPIIESLHFLGLCLLIGTVGLFDLRLLGFARGLPLNALHRLVPVGIAGFILNVVTGMMFLSTDAGQYLYNPAFQLKLLCVLLAGINVLLFYTVGFPGLRALRTDQALPWPIQLFGLVSLLSWVGVITFGRLITFYRPPYHWCFWCS